MAYDKGRHEAVLFAGTNYSLLNVGFPSETWVFNGTAWTQRFPVHAPQRFGEFQMAYDERRGVVVLLNPTVANEFNLLEHWEWDGTDWSNIPVNPAQSPRFERFRIAYDTRRGKLVLFGGLDSFTHGELKNETWEYDAGLRQWELRSTAGPAPRVPGGMAFDGARGVTMLVAGGKDWYPASYYDDVWIWDGVTWELRGAPLPLGPVEVVSLVYDEFSKVVWAFGAGEAADYYYPYTWAWDGVHFQCGPWNAITPLEGVCTNTIITCPSLLLRNPGIVMQPAPAAYDSDRLQVVGLTQNFTWRLARGNRQPVNFVDWRNPNPPGDGTAANPFVTVSDALLCVTDGSTLFMQAGTYQAGPIKLGRRVDVFALGGPVTIR